MAFLFIELAYKMLGRSEAIKWNHILHNQHGNWGQIELGFLYFYWINAIPDLFSPVVLLLKFYKILIDEPLLWV